MLCGPNCSGPNVPETNPKRLRDTYDLWVTALIRERISQSQKRREQAKRRASRRRSDEETLARWLTAHNDEFPRWIQQFGSGQDWDFSVDSLDALASILHAARWRACESGSGRLVVPIVAGGCDRSSGVARWAGFPGPVGLSSRRVGGFGVR